MNKIRFAAIGTIILVLAGCAQPGPGNYSRTPGYGQSGQYYGQTTNRPANNAALRTVGGAGAGALIAEATGGSKTKGALLGAIAGGLSCQATGGCY
ncbi:hypothetical protein JJJ17_17150 [Paracoccus caeni]|uniref:17 kDa surface antigen n=1 Tax=Paracoccus caeni TaxID=657651 RepID=A0A934SIE2_9RHOB|nr:hypothetical protein [Paracoccus caeni]MBK4217661.1 hypothetical protein [Paracoccus caeni]